MMKIIGVLTLTAVLQAVLLISLTVQAQNKKIVIYNDPIEYSQCTNSHGTPVHTSYQHKEIRIAADYAVAWRYKEKHPTYYYIHMNFGMFHNAPPLAREWVWYHECGHHRLGHTIDSERYAESTHSIVAAEHDADCFAAREFRKHHQGSELHLALEWNQTELGMSDIRIERIKNCR